MDYTFFYIVLLVTNLASPAVREFNLTVKWDDVESGKYHIARSRDKIWTIDYQADSATRSKDRNPFDTPYLNFTIKEKNAFRTLLTNTPISMDQFCECKDVDWRR